MQEPKRKGMRIIEHSVFRIAITLLGFTGLRINKIIYFNKKQFLHVLEKGEIQIYQSK